MDPRLTEAKAIPVRELVDRLGITGLRVAGGELVGPCPLCGGTDRFGINLHSRAFLCRKCGITGGDSVELVRQVLNLGFADALTWACGEAPASIDPAEVARRRAVAEAAEQRQREAQNRYREQSLRDARDIWARSRPGSQGVVRAYLMARGFLPDMLPELPEALRFLVDHPYVKKIGHELVTVHRGPCMIAGVLDAGGGLTAVHQTWVDPEPPHGKARITWQGTPMPAKMVRGSKKGAAIRLCTPEGADTLVMGEGIETTLTAMAAAAVPGAAYWAGVDLGNMAGRARRGEGMRYAGLPDLTDTEAFVPPRWVRRLIFIQDGDSDPRATRHKLECGLRRAMALRPGLRGQIVHPGEGVDLNDVLTGRDRQDDTRDNE